MVRLSELGKYKITNPHVLTQGELLPPGEFTPPDCVRVLWEGMKLPLTMHRSSVENAP